ncbi:3310_t:CDS:10 [Funneliformis mosseae]|uniref:DNA replication licensing factor MCM6 n=1 Tax=Funneliformis mosseae TaxID=27381 RepID=A0A9N9ACC9_FUNMO|nr:3310_t:CDS:10 [Funneliformis mosseae]
MDVDRSGEAEEVVKKGVPRQKKIFEGIQKAKDEFASEFGYLFIEFIENFESKNEILEFRPYLKQLENMVHEDRHVLYVNFSDIFHWEDTQTLWQAILYQYYRIEPYLRKAVEILVDKYFPNEDKISNNKNENDLDADQDDDVFLRTVNKKRKKMDEGEAARESLERSYALDYLVAFHDMPTIHRIREIKTERIGCLMSISGTVTRTSEVRPELLFGKFTCQECKVDVPNVEQQFRYTEPPMCQTPTCNNRTAWVLDSDHSVFTDWQRIRIQENPNEIPTGSMPRTLEVIVRQEMVEKAKPGNKCIFVGTPLVIPDINQLGIPGTGAEVSRDNRSNRTFADGLSREGVTGLKALGARDLSYKISFMACTVHTENVKLGKTLGSLEYETVDEDQKTFISLLTDDEKNELIYMSRDENIFEKLVKSIAPSVFGHEIVKKGILLQLLGGVHKITPEGIKLRGDINVCIVGDPSTSKSQFLKYACVMNPRSVFTSGKSASAAGLTAAVVKDEESGDFTIEAGALMLADNGICAIDEFDKMDIPDQVAIHEAMEQQTITIAKAGIHATLNARTSILAAANPRDGRYNRKLTLRVPPIMSRFDLFFVVLDECKPDVDKMIANYIVGTHRHGDDNINPHFDTAKLQRYIRYARTFKPKITSAAAKLFSEKYRDLRQDDAIGAGRNSYRITVRQLESMIRLSEAIAKAHCNNEIIPEYVNEACNLLQQSIIHVYHDDLLLDEDEEEVNDQMDNDDVNPENDDTMEVDNDGDSNSNQATPQRPSRSDNSITFEEFTKIRDKIISRLKVKGSCEEGELIQWCMEEHESELTVESFSTKETKFKKVVKQLIKDEWLLPIGQTAFADDEMDPEESDDVDLPIDDQSSRTVLAIHPNVDIHNENLG